MKKNKLAPIIIFTYNRYKHFEITLKSLSKNYLSKESELYINSNAVIISSPNHLHSQHGLNAVNNKFK